MGKRPKKKQKTPRQRAKKGLEDIIDWVKKQEPKDIQDLILDIGLAAAGYQMFRDWKGALIGPVGLRLATSDNLAAGAAGVASLAMLGLSGISTSGVEPDEKALYGLLIKKDPKCPKDHVLRWNIVEGWHCEPLFPLT